jgi:putative membrane protein
MTVAHHLVGPARVWSTWAFDPVTVVLLACAAALYWRGLAKIAPRSHQRDVALRAAAFYAGLVLCALALLSPLHALAEALFSAHMLQHLILMLVVAPLLVFGSAPLLLWLGTPRPLKARLRNPRHVLSGRLRRIALNPAVVTLVYAVALWVWHLPGPYSAALEDPMLHALEHATFLGTSLLFWSLVIPSSVHRHTRYPVALAVVFFTALQSGGLGALLTFATQPLYAVHTRLAPLFDVRPLVDQQLAGLLMWVPPGAVYLVTMTILFLRWFRAMDADISASRVVEAGDPS